MRARHRVALDLSPVDEHPTREVLQQPARAPLLLVALHDPVGDREVVAHELLVARVLPVAHQRADPVQRVVGDGDAAERQVARDGHRQQAVGAPAARGQGEVMTGEPPVGVAHVGHEGVHVGVAHPRPLLAAGAVEERVGRAEVERARSDLPHALEAFVVTRERRPFRTGEGALVEVDVDVRPPRMVHREVAQSDRVEEGDACIGAGVPRDVAPGPVARLELGQAVGAQVLAAGDVDDRAGRPRARNRTWPRQMRPRSNTDNRRSPCGVRSRPSNAETGSASVSARTGWSSTTTRTGATGVDRSWGMRRGSGAVYGAAGGRSTTVPSRDVSTTAAGQSEPSTVASCSPGGEPPVHDLGGQPVQARPGRGQPFGRHRPPVRAAQDVDRRVGCRLEAERAPAERPDDGRGHPPRTGRAVVATVRDDDVGPTRRWGARSCSSQPRNWGSPRTGPRPSSTPLT